MNGQEILNSAITLTREEAQQVLDALTYHYKGRPEDYEAIYNLRARLSAPEPQPHAMQNYAHNAYEAATRAQPKPEPVAWAYRDSSSGDLFGFTSEHYDDEPAKNLVPLYTAPPQREWQGLTDEELNEIYNQDGLIYKPLKFYRAIEAKLKEKNG